MTITPEVLAELESLRAENARLKSLSPGPKVEVGEYKGHKTLTITPANARPFNIGVAKLTHIFAMQDMIEEALTQ